MSQILLLNPIEGIAQAVESEDVMTFAQTSEGVNLSEPSDAPAAAGKSGGMGSMGIIWILLLLVMMFVMLRPKKDKEGDKFRNALQREQEVVTSSGIFGKIKDIDDISVTLEISQNNRIRVDKRYINPIPTVQPVQPAKSSKKKEEHVPNKEEKA